MPKTQDRSRLQVLLQRMQERDKQFRRNNRGELRVNNKKIMEAEIKRELNEIRIALAETYMNYVKAYGAYQELVKLLQ